MKKLFKLFAFTCLAMSATAQNKTPIYLDETKPIEQRVEDALQRMTLEEKNCAMHNLNSVPMAYPVSAYRNFG